MLSFTLSILRLGLGLWLCRPVSRRDQRVIGWVFGICLNSTIPGNRSIGGTKYVIWQGATYSDEG